MSVWSIFYDVCEVVCVWNWCDILFVYGVCDVLLWFVELIYVCLICIILV